jgi:hypothetical protein
MRRDLSIPRFIGRGPNLFHVWLSWLRDLGGTFVPYHNLDEPKPPTGRRDPDTKPRQYELDDKKYGMDPKTGTIWRRPNA